MGGQRHSPVALPPERTGTNCIGGWVGHRAGLEGAEKLSSTGIRSSDRPARSKSLYRLSYRGRNFISIVKKIEKSHTLYGIV